MNFLNTWCRRSAGFNDIVDVIRDWMSTEWGNERPILVFTYTPELTPLIRRTVEVYDIRDNTVELRFEIFNSWGDSWYDEVDMSEVPWLLFDFLGLDPDQEIYIDLNPKPWLKE